MLNFSTSLPLMQNETFEMLYSKFQINELIQTDLETVVITHISGLVFSDLEVMNFDNVKSGIA